MPKVRQDENMGPLQLAPRVPHRAILFARLVVIGSIVFLLASCSSGGGSATPPLVTPPASYTATGGLAQKGPLIKGSTVTAQELDSRLSPIGRQYTYQVTSDLGSFSPTSTFGARYIGINATGYYFDEVASAVSTGTVTLNSYSDLAASQLLNVNLLTTLAYQRIQRLVAGSGMTFAAARTQAENEVLAAFNIPAGNYRSFDTLDLGGDSDGDHILAAISSIFAYGHSAGPLSQLVADFQSDIATNGVITSAATKAALMNAGKGINPAAVAASLSQAYSSVGVRFSAADISNWIDQDGDGVVGQFKFQVPDATPSTSFAFPTSVLSQVAGVNVSVTGGRLSVNGVETSGAAFVRAGDALTLSPGTGPFPNGVLSVYLNRGSTRVARVSFVSGLVSIAVTPGTPGIPKGLTQQFRATGTFSDTSRADVTTSAIWDTSAPTVATIDSNSGLARTLAAGSTVVTVTSGSVSGSTTLNVTPAILDSLAITPSPATGGVGLTTQLRAIGTYSDATTANVTNSAIWTSSSTSVATVGPTTGLVTGVSPGATSISAAIGSVAGIASMAVKADTWTLAGAMASARYSHTATLLKDGKVLVAGGNTGSSVLDSAELYDPVADTWLPANSLGSARHSHTATLLPNGKVLVTGGFDVASNVTASAELYDPVADSWSPVGSMLIPRSLHTASLLPNGKVLVAGGTSTASAELWDPVANTWSPAGNMSIARFAHTATLLMNGQVLVAGGSIGGSVTAELYNPVANTWSPAGSLSTARSYHSATLLPSGKVLAAGGSNSGGARFGTASSELYDPVANMWSPAGSMSTARAYLTSTLLPSGRIMVVGGGDFNFIVQAAVDLYDPVANTWTPGGSLATGRMLHTATVLQGGAVLVAAGSIGPRATNAAELYW